MKRFCALFLTFALLTDTIAGAALFPDVPQEHWAAQYISAANDQGWVQGMEDGSYAPGQNLTAAQFLSMVCNAFFPERLAEEPQGAAWFSPSWSLSQRLGLSQGSGLSQTNLSQPISRNDMAQVIFNALIAADVDLDHIAGDEASGFSDWGQIPSSYYPAISASYRLSILNGKPGNVFGGQEPMTRAEAAAVLCRMSDAVEKDRQNKPMDVSAQVLELVNQERAKEGLSPLALDEKLTESALIRAGELKISFSHTRPDGSPCGTALDETGAYDGASRSGENIAVVYGDAKTVVNAWMDSPGHRSNILDPGFTHMASARCGNFWTQMFIGRH